MNSYGYKQFTVLTCLVLRGAYLPHFMQQLRQMIVLLNFPVAKALVRYMMVKVYEMQLLPADV